ncbi:hypothetical protein RN001_007263 [Aquatica leii]|uniref:RING-type domain-containing protein n=1 Tax=Aquatica leii TaxID=1421715 RepID=A0AAN7P838_9COLE|nr:hypothetical protein RN001_007263 [Aquatica leii]
MFKNGIVQWGWPEIEELLQCPICLDIPATGPGLTVEQCIHGHHICYSCKTKVENCPLCKCSFHGTRNFVVEELLRHFEILKNTMLLNNMVVDTKPKKKKKVKLNANAPSFEPNQLPVRRNVNTPKANKGLYPCRVEDCDVSLPAARLLNHVRCFHADNLTESTVDIADSYSQTWEVTKKIKKPINKTSFVVFVSGIGLVFLTIEMLRSGQLIAVVQTAMKFRQAQAFLASVEFFSVNATFSYNTRLLSVRDNIPHMLQTKNCFTLTKTQVDRLRVNNKFNCKLRLSRYNNIDFDLLTVPNTDVHTYIAGVRASLVDEQSKKLKTEAPSKSVKTVVNEPAIPQASSSSLSGFTMEELLSESFQQKITEILKSVCANQSTVNTDNAPTTTGAKKKKNKNKNKKK